MQEIIPAMLPMPASDPELNPDPLLLFVPSEVGVGLEVWLEVGVEMVDTVG